MIEIGRHNELSILRETSVGLFLGDDEGNDVLLPNKYCPNEFNIGDKLNVFVYLDNEERIIATTLKPKISLFGFALLKVVAITRFGAFVDWGLEKNLIVPFSEQHQDMELNGWYVVYLDYDKKTDRLFASNKIENYLQNDSLIVETKQAVNLLVYSESELGYSVIVNNIHQGLIYRNEVYKTIYIGDKLTGYVKKIREENKLDISLQAIGYENVNDTNSQTIYKYLKQNNGFSSITDKSTPETIYREFEMSKKSFKKALGNLYKQRIVSIKKDGIYLVEEQ